VPSKPFDLFVNDDFIQQIFGNAAAIKESDDVDMEPTEHNLQKYIVYILATGLVPYAQERLPFRNNKVHGLFKNDFLTSLFSHKELLCAKKLFKGVRDALTEIFNNTAESLGCQPSKQTFNFEKFDSDPPSIA
jgi:hypothetical protein